MQFIVDDNFDSGAVFSVVFSFVAHFLLYYSVPRHVVEGCRLVMLSVLWEMEDMYQILRVTDWRNWSAELVTPTAVLRTRSASGARYNQIYKILQTLHLWNIREKTLLLCVTLGWNNFHATPQKSFISVFYFKFLSRLQYFLLKYQSELWSRLFTNIHLQYILLSPSRHWKKENLPLTSSVSFSVQCHVDLVHSLALWCVWRVTLLLIWVDVEFAPLTLWGHVTQGHALPGWCLIGPIVLSLVAVVSGMWSPKQSDSALKWQRTANFILYSFSLGWVHDRDRALH